LHHDERVASTTVRNDLTIFGDGGEFAQPACTTIGGGVYTAVCLAMFD
jgi:hypothetical protein